MMDTPETSEPLATALLQEHGELVDLIIHEESVAWQLNLVLLGANSGLLAAVHSLGLLDLQTPISAALVIVLGVGVIFNAAGVVVTQRRTVYRLSRLYRACRVEAELSLLGRPIRTFSAVERTLAAGRMLVPPESSAPPPAPPSTRALRFYERVTVLDLRLAFHVVALTYLALAIWAALGRPA